MTALRQAVGAAIGGEVDGVGTDGDGLGKGENKDGEGLRLGV